MSRRGFARFDHDVPRAVSALGVHVEFRAHPAFHLRRTINVETFAGSVSRISFEDRVVNARCADRRRDGGGSLRFEFAASAARSGFLFLVDESAGAYV